MFHSEGAWKPECQLHLPSWKTIRIFDSKHAYHCFLVCLSNYWYKFIDNSTTALMVEYMEE